MRVGLTAAFLAARAFLRVVYGLVRSLKRAALEDPTLEPRATRTMALRKLATAEDVAAQVVLLASDRTAGHVSNGVVRRMAR